MSALSGRDGFPGRYRPGLIEASGAGSGRRRWRTFRGVIAPASLKHHTHHNEGVVNECFPGRYRPGLIEARRGGMVAAGDAGAPFPGRYRPGLIEALPAPSARRRPPPLSGALSPRPH